MPINVTPTSWMIEANPEFLECKICLLKYDEGERAPRMLTCGHTLCSECADTLWKKQNHQKINCPFDRTVTTLPNTQLGVNSLAKNFSLLEVIESEKKKVAEEPLINSEPSDTPCAENPHHEAIVFCVSCEMDFCKKCYAKIHLPRVFQSHKKLPLSKKPIQLPNCPRHPYNTAEFKCQKSFCSQPSKLFCKTCSLQEHKGHWYEHLLETASRNQKELEDLLLETCAKTELLRHCIQLQEKSISSFKPDSALLLETRNDIINRFEEKKGVALATFDSWAEFVEKEAAEQKEDLESRCQEASGVKKEIEKILKSKANLFSIEDVAKRAEGFLNRELKHHLSIDQFDIYLNKEMDLQCKAIATK